MQAPRTAAARVLDLQRQVGNRAVARILARKPKGFSPAAMYSDWRQSIGVGGMRASLDFYLYENTNVSDRGFTIEDEFEAAIAIDPAFLTNQQDAARLEIWQKQLRTAFRSVKASIGAADWGEAVRQLATAYERAMAIYDLPMAAPQYDVTWKKQVKPDGEIVVRSTGARVEALFEVQPAGSGRAEKKNLNVSLRRHWWKGLDLQSVGNPAGNSLMGPKIELAMIQDDLRAVAKEYISKVSKRDYSSEFGFDTPSGVHYHVNRLDNQQPHCFPNRGTSTVSLTQPEYNAAVALNLYSDAVERGKAKAYWPVSEQQVRNHLQNAGGIINKLKQIGVGFSEALLKDIA